MHTFHCTAPPNLWTVCGTLLIINFPENLAVFVTPHLKELQGALVPSSREKPLVLFSGHVS
jgi:hypothetical protein